MPSLMGEAPSNSRSQISRSKRETEILSVPFGRPRKSAFRYALGCRSKVQYPRSLPTATYGHFVFNLSTVENYRFTLLYASEKRW